MRYLLTALFLAGLLFAAIPSSGRPIVCVPILDFDECEVDADNPGEPPAWCGSVQGRVIHLIEVKLEEWTSTLRAALKK